MGGAFSSSSPDETSFSIERKEYRSAPVSAPVSPLPSISIRQEEERKVERRKKEERARIQSIAPGTTIIVAAGVDFAQLAREASMMRKIRHETSISRGAPPLERKVSINLALKKKKEADAAVKIQRAFRGYAVRKHVALYRKRTEVVRELLHTEKDYLRFLNVILTLYYYTLKEKANSDSPPLTVEELNVIFPQIEMLKMYNTLLLESLEYRICVRWNYYQTIGDSFLSLIKFLKPPYVYYISHFPQIVQMIRTVSKRTHMLFFLRECKSAPESAGLDLQALVSMPFQRVPRYIMLMKEVLKYTPRQHADFPLLRESLTKMEEIANVANDRLREEESIRTMMRINNRLNPPVANLLLPFRKLVYEGRVMCKVGRAHQSKQKREGESNTFDHLSSSPARSCLMYLFTDCLLLTEENRISMLIETNPKLKPRLVVNLENAMIFDMPQLNDDESMFEFQVHSLDASVVFGTKTLEEKKKWMGYITDAINDLTERACTYHPFWRNRSVE